jgi:cytoskeletal protein RodZ
MPARIRGIQAGRDPCSKEGSSLKHLSIWISLGRLVILGTILFAVLFAAIQQRSDTLKNQQATAVAKAEATGFAKGEATAVTEQATAVAKAKATAVAKAKATGIAQGQATATAQKKPVSTPAPQKALVVNQYQQVKQHFLTRRTASSPHQAQLERMRIKWYQLLFSEAHSWSW